MAVTGCVSKVSGGHTFGVPFVRDTTMGHYRRSVDQVFEAAKQVVMDNGDLARESTLHQTNAVKTVEGTINQCKVFMKIEAIEPQLTAVSVQVRRTSGGTDVDLSHELEKQIALKLATR